MTGGGPKAAEKPARRRRAYMPAAERRKSIIAAAQQVFARQHLQGARTRDIAKAAEVNQATIFEHFESKEELFHEAVVKPLIAAMNGMHERVEVYEAARTPAELAALARNSAKRHIDDMLEIFPLMAAALFSDPENGPKLYREQVAPLLRERGAVLGPIVKDGIDPEFVGLASFGMLFAIAMDRSMGGTMAGGDLADVAAQFTRLSTEGFARDRTAIATREKDDAPEA